MDINPPVAAAIVVEDGRVLLVRRRRVEGTLVWQFPAGKVEPEETGEQAAVRETLEEAGLEVRALRKLGERIHPATGRHMIYVVCEVHGGSLHVAGTSEIAEIEWCDRVALAAHVPYPFYEPVQAYLDASLG